MDWIKLLKWLMYCAWLSIPITIIIGLIGFSIDANPNDEWGLLFLMIGSLALIGYLLIIEGSIAIVLSIIYLIVKAVITHKKKEIRTINTEIVGFSKIKQKDG